MWTLFRFAASMSNRPSRTLCEHGFSTYTCLPASAARIAPGVCQWSGVAIHTAFTALSSNTRRMSFSAFTACPASAAILAASFSLMSSTSHT